MGRIRVGLLIALAGALLTSGCGGSGGPVRPNAASSPAPTAPVGANGQPITALCDLLTAADLKEIAKLEATKPDTAKATMTEASCVYGKNIEMDVYVVDNLQRAADVYQTSLTKGPLKAVAQSPLGAVDESVFGTVGAASGLNVRRLRLVVALKVPSGVTDAKVALIRLAATVLTRANALGA